jgi:hypothetical protein
MKDIVNVLLARRGQGIKQIQHISSDAWMEWRVRTERHVVRTDDAWSVWSPDSMARRPNGWNSDRWASGRLTGN